MAAYQVPQFLDSGDKIIFNMNMRQFGYALGGMLLGLMISTIMQSLVPGIGAYSWVPAAPVVMLAAYLALGSFNGRDSEVYVLKFALFFLKPRAMVYQRSPDMSDINAKMNGWTEAAINKRWEEELNKKNQPAENNSDFRSVSTDTKASRIRNLGRSIDTNLQNTLADIENKNLAIRANESLIRELQAKQLAQKGQLPPANPVSNTPEIPTAPKSDQFNDNYFNSKSPGE